MLVLLHARYYDLTARGEKVHIARCRSMRRSLCGLMLRRQAWPAPQIELPDDSLLCASCRKHYLRGER